jgi:hypothetical protein
MLSSGNGRQVTATSRNIAIGLFHLASITRITRAVAPIVAVICLGDQAGSRRSRNRSRWPGDRPTAEQHFELR